MAPRPHFRVLQPYLSFFSTPPTSSFVVALSLFSDRLLAFACWPVVLLLTFSGRVDSGLDP